MVALSYVARRSRVPRVWVNGRLTARRTAVDNNDARRRVSRLFHDPFLRSYLYHCVWSVITAHISLQSSVTIIIRITL